MNEKLVAYLCYKNVPISIRDVLRSQDNWADLRQEIEILIFELERLEYKEGRKIISKRMYRFLRNYGFCKPKGGSNWYCRYQNGLEGKEVRKWIGEQDNDENDSSN